MIHTIDCIWTINCISIPCSKQIKLKKCISIKIQFINLFKTSFINFNVITKSLYNEYNYEGSRFFVLFIFSLIELSPQHNKLKPVEAQVLVITLPAIISIFPCKKHVRFKIFANLKITIFSNLDIYKKSKHIKIDK
jgi:hypothetical protein